MILLYNVQIYSYPKEVNSVIIKNDKIYFIGQLNKIPNGEYKQKIDLKNKLLLPSFIDTHTHFSEYMRLKSQIDFSKAKNIDDIKKIISENPNKTKGYALKISLFNKKELHHYFLNLKRELPLTIASSDYHSYLTTEIGLTNFPTVGQARRPAHTTIGEFVTELYKYGITSIHEMAFSREDFELYGQAQRPAHTLEVYRHFPLEMLDEIIKNGTSTPLSNLNKNIMSLKLFYDGSIGSGTALMLAPKSTKGDFLTESSPLGGWGAIEENIKKALVNNLSVSIHAIGDKAVDDIVNLFIKHKDLIKTFVRIEHAQTISDKTIKKLETMKDKIYLAMQPLHIRDDYKLLKNTNIEKTSFRFKSLENMVVGFGSDTPVVEFSPFLGIYHAITHKLNPQEAITAKKAIDNYTINAAKLSNTQDIEGSIEVGKKANLILIDDYKEYDNDFWLNCKNYLTILKGDIVYRVLF